MCSSGRERGTSKNSRQTTEASAREGPDCVCVVIGNGAFEAAKKNSESKQARSLTAEPGAFLIGLSFSFFALYQQSQQLSTQARRTAVKE